MTYFDSVLLYIILFSLAVFLIFSPTYIIFRGLEHYLYLFLFSKFH